MMNKGSEFITVCIKMIKVADFYCGIGGFSAGALEAGAEIVFGIDCDSTVLREWAGNTKATAVLENISVDNKNIPWPNKDVHIHLSPPCTQLSQARPGRLINEKLMSLHEMREMLHVVIARGQTSFSMENVSTPLTKALANEFKGKFPAYVDFIVLDAATFGVPSDRVRLIIGSPAIIAALSIAPVCRVSVRNAFEKAGLPLPSEYIKSCGRQRNGGPPYVRSVDWSSPTVVSSHPLTWCSRDGTTLRCLTVKESSVLMGFTADWTLPSGQRKGIQGVGNAIPPPLAKAIVEAAIQAAKMQCIVCNEDKRAGSLQITDCCGKAFHWSKECAETIGIRVRTGGPRGDIFCEDCTKGTSHFSRVHAMPRGTNAIL